MKLLYEKLNGRDPHEAGLSLLQKLYGAPLPEIKRTPLGKPYFPGEDVYFSISHTKNYVFCAIAENPVGIDAEELDRDIRLSLAEKFLSPGELKQFQNAPDKKRALLTFWVLKEAAGKCTGEGLQLWPNHTDFSLNDPRVRELDGCLVAVIEAL
ncbi:MAG: 4'-phosphopantetheinyl transferase superfamily protein [Oscillospiraceae bacterium]|nr:4'-phosphopantetheinyl transferase superfamily protein [Oscillospiraceae bacterium]MBQ7330079.1 4'-phosphopantetheinyl transferase superfamily protein [Oscillospiraceae bacterium]